MSKHITDQNLMDLAETILDRSADDLTYMVITALNSLNLSKDLALGINIEIKLTFDEDYYESNIN